jgi:hypothetical protein
MKTLKAAGSIIPIKAALVAGAAALLMTAGCAAPQATSDTPSGSGSPSAAVSAAETAVTEAAAPVPYLDNPTFSLPSRGVVKAGEPLRVTGSGITPGVVITIYGAELVMSNAAKDQKDITERVTFVASADGNYSVDLLFPEGLAPGPIWINAEFGAPPADFVSDRIRAEIR